MFPFAHGFFDIIGIKIQQLTCSMLNITILLMFTPDISYLAECMLVVFVQAMYGNIQSLPLMSLPDFVCIRPTKTSLCLLLIRDTTL